MMAAKPPNGRPTAPKNGRHIPRIKQGEREPEGVNFIREIPLENLERARERYLKLMISLFQHEEHT